MMGEAKFIDLSGDWLLHCLSLPVDVSRLQSPVQAIVPGVVHTDPLRAGIIEDPYRGNNEISYKYMDSNITDSNLLKVDLQKRLEIYQRISDYRSYIGK